MSNIYIDGAVIRRGRIKAALKVETICDALMITRQALWNVEHGRASPWLTFMVAEKLGLPPVAFVKRTRAPRKDRKGKHKYPAQRKSIRQTLDNVHDILGEPMLADIEAHIVQEGGGT